MISDAIIPAAVRFADLPSLLKKYLKAPMAKSQEGMNICNKGKLIHPFR